MGKTRKELTVTKKMIEAAAAAFDESGVLDYPDIGINHQVVRGMLEAAMEAAGYAPKKSAGSQRAR